MKQSLTASLSVWMTTFDCRKESCHVTRAQSTAKKSHSKMIVLRLVTLMASSKFFYTSSEKHLTFLPLPSTSTAPIAEKGGDASGSNDASVNTYRHVAHFIDKVVGASASKSSSNLFNACSEAPSSVAFSEQYACCVTIARHLFEIRPCSWPGANCIVPRSFKASSFFKAPQEIIEGNLEVKFPTIWRDGKAEVGTVKEEKIRDGGDQRGRKSKERINGTVCLQQKHGSTLKDSNWGFHLEIHLSSMVEVHDSCCRTSFSTGFGVLSKQIRREEQERFQPHLACVANSSATVPPQGW